MLTRNYYECLDGALTQKVCTVTSNEGAKIKASSTNAARMGSATLSKSITASTNGTIVLGTGTVAPTLDDYNLSGNIVSTFNCLSDSVIVTDIDGGIKTVRTFIVENTGTADITIGEIAWFYRETDSGSQTGFDMRDRTVLDTPLTIPAGETGQVDYVIITKFGTA